MPIFRNKLTNKVNQNQPRVHVCGENASMGKEFREDWIQRNIFPLNERSVATKILKGRL